MVVTEFLFLLSWCLWPSWLQTPKLGEQFISQRDHILNEGKSNFVHWQYYISLAYSMQSDVLNLIHNGVDFQECSVYVIAQNYPINLSHCLVLH